MSETTNETVDSNQQTNNNNNSPISSTERDKANTPIKVVISDNELTTLSYTDWMNRWKQQDLYVASLERRVAQQEGDLEDLRQTNDRIRTQLTDSQQRERVLVRRLAAKEQETQDYVCQLNELKNIQIPTSTTLRSTLLDPAVNSIILQLRNELQLTRSKLEDTQNELTAWKFTPDSNTGKRLMAKCRLLYQENEELGKITSQGRIAKLESDLALQKSFSEEVRKSQNELDSFLADLDEDVEGMQSTILFLQQELRKCKESQLLLQKENCTLKLNNNSNNNNNQQQQQQQQTNGRSNGENSVTSNVNVIVNVKQERTDSDNEQIILTSNNNDERTRVIGGVNSNNSNKRLRRSSVLSIDYNEDDINTNGDVAMSSDPE